MYRGPRRNYVSRLPNMDRDEPERHKFKRNSVGYFHIHSAGGRTEAGMLHLFAAGVVLIGMPRISCVRGGRESFEQECTGGTMSVGFEFRDHDPKAWHDIGRPPLCGVEFHKVPLRQVGLDHGARH